MLSLTQKRWIVPETKVPIHSSHILARLLAERGINPNEHPEIISPSVFDDIEKATTRIQKAIEQHEKIGIFGDYDCDGVTAVAQLVRYFRRKGVTPFVRLPHRVKDGYGLHSGIVQEYIKKNISLLITADTGVTSVKEIDVLSAHGIDVIVTDHHNVLDGFPHAYAIIHPARSNHPLPHPSGSGVAFSLVYALEDGEWDDMYSDLALAMMGTVADLVELKGANRALTELGLVALERISSGPLATLRDRCRQKDLPFHSQDIAFRIAPRINAAGRMGAADIALRAVLDGGDDLDTINTLNEERKVITKDLLDSVVDTFTDTETPAMLMSISEEYPHGIVGLIAGRLTEHFGRPSLVAHSDGETCVASLRSPPCYNIAEGLSRCSEHLLRFGGHAQAAGCTFLFSNADALSQALLQDVLTHTSPELLHPTLTADAEISACDITVEFCEKLTMLEPYGQGNTEPSFLIRDIRLQNLRACGKENTHLQCRISGIQAIGFNMAELASEIEKYDILAKVNINEWNGNKTAQLKIVDMRLTVNSE
ncbi:single-stranded-DNA-specific exonuclease RecJ [Candidatus Peregrinibacteria bacterium CG10_big_fil_rev_8_21_14_0_10_42_8]|nr:MAG: single-stranded-DNA-specific exonuclease RecJ [Candidatus Peregrinibacteria bacterium CG10_big_fil_rev_8_21_14_0_10_42_8]